MLDLNDFSRFSLRFFSALPKIDLIFDPSLAYPSCVCILCRSRSLPQDAAFRPVSLFARCKGRPCLNAIIPDCGLMSDRHVTLPIRQAKHPAQEWSTPDYTVICVRSVHVIIITHPLFMPSISRMSRSASASLLTLTNRICSYALSLISAAYRRLLLLNVMTVHNKIEFLLQNVSVQRSLLPVPGHSSLPLHILPIALLSACPMVRQNG